MRRIRYWPVLLFMVASIAAAETLIIENVMLIDRSDKGSDRDVHLLLKNGRLDQVTVDATPDIKDARIVDAKNGLVLGRLDVGNAASFMILDEDPRENIEALLDTETHAVFVIKDGEIIRDRLEPRPMVAEGEQNKPEWFAYTAPPISLPTSYESTRKWNRFETKIITGTFFGALALDRTKWLGQDDTSEAQVGDLDAYSEGEIRALRFGLIGAIKFPNPWIYTFAAATHAFDKGFDIATSSKIGIYDARLDIPIWHDTSLAIGKQKEPISMERLTSMVNLPMQERSAVSDAMLPSRNTGIVLSGTGFDRNITWAGGAFSSWLDQEVSIGEATAQLVGRGTWVPLANPSDSSIVHLGLGLRYTNAKQGGRYLTEPEINLSPAFVDTGDLVADGGMLYDLEAGWRWGSLWLMGEFIINQIDSPTAGDPTFTGWHATASYALTGEMRAYNRRNGLFRPLPVAKPVNAGGWGAVEIAARYSTIDLNEGNVQGGDMDVYSLGGNWWLTRFTSFGVNYRHVVLEDVNGVGHSDGVTARVLLILE